MDPDAGEPGGQGHHAGAHDPNRGVEDSHEVLGTKRGLNGYNALV